MHAIGFWHEHSRPDRGKHVEIIDKNIKSENIRNFYIQNINQANLVGEYDICSVMHYHEWGFTNKEGRREGDKTIVPIRKDYDCTMGQRMTWTDIDVQKINLYYNCKGIEGTLFNWHGHQETPCCCQVQYS